MPWLFRRRTVRLLERASGLDWTRVPPLEPVVNPQAPALGPVLSPPEVAGTEDLLARADAGAGSPIEPVRGVVTGTVRRGVADVPLLEPRRRFRVFRRAQPRPARMKAEPAALDPSVELIDAKYPEYPESVAEVATARPRSGGEAESGEPAADGEARYTMPVEVQVRRRPVPVVRRDRRMSLPLTTVSAENVGDPIEPQEPFRSIGPFERMLAEYEASDALGIAALAGFSSVAVPPPDPVVAPPATAPPAATVERPTLAQSRRQGLRAAALAALTPEPSGQAASAPYLADALNPDSPEPQPSSPERSEVERSEVAPSEDEASRAQRVEDGVLRAEDLEGEVSEAERVDDEALEVAQFEAGRVEWETSEWEMSERRSASESLGPFTAASSATETSTSAAPDQPQPEPTSSEPLHSEESVLSVPGSEDSDPDASGPSPSVLRASGLGSPGKELSALPPWVVDAVAADRTAEASSMVPTSGLLRLRTSVLGPFGVAPAALPRSVPQRSAARRTPPDRLTTSAMWPAADGVASAVRGPEGAGRLVSPWSLAAPSSTVRRTPSSGLDLPAFETSVPGSPAPLRLHPVRAEATAYRSLDSLSSASTPDGQSSVQRPLTTEQNTDDTTGDTAEIELWSLENATPELAAALQAREDHTGLQSAPNAPTVGFSVDQAQTALLALSGGEAVMKRLAELEGSLRELSELVTRDWDADWLLMALSEAWLIDRVADRLYPAVRRRLRGELLIDRERRGVLADLR